jgi:hypothetical protein
MSFEKPTYFRAFGSLRCWLSNRLAAPASGSTAASQKIGRSRLAVACAFIFLLAFGVRLLHWQDDQLNIAAERSLAGRYKQQAQRMLDGNGILYPTGYKENSNAQLLVHPPGYSIFIAIVFRLFGQSDINLSNIQIICDSLASVLVLVIALQFFRLAASVIGGLLAAFSPHLAHHSIVLMPESLSVVPILISILLLIRAAQRPRLVLMITAGAMIGVSCWLRSNALLLAPFLAVAILLLSERRRRLKDSLAFLCAAIVIISPITIRNWVVTGYFIPLSLGSGITLIEGIADYDSDQRFGLPQTDHEAGFKDVEWHNRPDYAVSLWRPDGVERDRYRFARGMEVIRKNPIWFSGVMIRRAASMLRYNDSLSLGWPANTAIAPLVSLEPAFGHQVLIEGEPVWSTPAPELLAQGQLLSPRTEAVLAEDRNRVTVAGNQSPFDDQFCSAPVAVRPNTDYVLRIEARLLEGDMAAKVTSADQRISLASHILRSAEQLSSSRRDAEGGSVDSDNDDPATSPRAPPPATKGERLLMPFATGRRSEVLLVLSNNGASPVRSKVALGDAQLFEVGATPHQWSRLVRPAVRGIQRNLYKTFRMLPLVGIGIILLAIARRFRVMLALLVVPAYYLSVQSFLHTEYRYILPIHYFLLAIAGLALGCFGVAIKDGLNHAIRHFTRVRGHEPASL